MLAKALKSEGYPNLIGLSIRTSRGSLYSYSLTSSLTWTSLYDEPRVQSTLKGFTTSACGTSISIAKDVQ